VLFHQKRIRPWSILGHHSEDNQQVLDSAEDCRVEWHFGIGLFGLGCLVLVGNFVVAEQPRSQVAASPWWKDIVVVESLGVVRFEEKS